MTDDVQVLHGRTVLVCDAAGPAIDTAQAALDLIGQAWGSQADLLAVPVSRLTEEFFTLSSGLAGEVTQKFVNYHLQLAIVGSITDRVAASSALRAFVGESNDGRHVWFLTDLDQLRGRLERTAR